MRVIMPKIERVKIEKLGREVVLTDLSVGYIDRCKQDPAYDTVVNALRESSDLTNEEIETLGLSEGRELYRIIVELTFGADAKEGGEDDGGKR